MNSLLDAVHQCISFHGLDKTYWIAYSGGLDSHVLLSLCYQLRKQIPIKLAAIHINHCLSPHARAWALHCADVCKAYEITYHEKTIHIDLSAGDSLEEVAREQRYAIFSNCLDDGDVLLTAHQQDDQAETLLLQLLRGAGLKGLSAMPISKPLGRGYHDRPLLAFTRAQLQQYAQAQQLAWIDDESNHNTKLSRNYIRHEILPLLKMRWPSVTSAIARSAAHCAEAEAMLDIFALQQCQQIKGSRQQTLSVSKLLHLDAAKQRLLLRTWIYHLGFQLPNAKKIENIRHDVLLADYDRMPCVSWDGTDVRRYQDDLYILPTLAAHAVDSVIAWDLIAPLHIPSIGNLHAASVKGRGVSGDIKQVSIRFRQGGEMANIPGRGRHTLKNLFQEWDVPTWERDRIPLVFVADQFISAVGYFVDPDFAAKKDELGLEIILDPASK